MPIRGPDKPPLTLQTTTLWEYPSQHYGDTIQGDQSYQGATPSYILWNLVSRYTRHGDLVVDPMCGSGTTLDVISTLDRRGVGFDISPYRRDVLQADARAIPLQDETADFVFVDPPYGDNLTYSDDARCIGRLSAFSEEYFSAMAQVIAEVFRILKHRRYLALYVCDIYKKKRGFVPLGMKMFVLLEQYFHAADIVSVVRRNRTMKRRRWHRAAIDGNYFLRGFNYLLIFKKEAGRAAGTHMHSMPGTA